MKRIFIIDDSMFIITQLSQIVKKAGYDLVGYAVNGQDALNKIRLINEKIDIFTIDITMPGMDGLETLKEISSLSLGSKFVIISAIGKLETVKRAKEIGAASYIMKPILKDKVLERLSKL